jgi:hypothetical protein
MLSALDGTPLLASPDPAPSADTTAAAVATADPGPTATATAQVTTAGATTIPPPPAGLPTTQATIADLTQAATLGTVPSFQAGGAFRPADPAPPPAPLAIVIKDVEWKEGADCNYWVGVTLTAPNPGKVTVTITVDGTDKPPFGVDRLGNFETTMALTACHDPTDANRVCTAVATDGFLTSKVYEFTIHQTAVS